MGVDLRMEPYAEMFEKERPGLRIIDEFCFPDIDKLFGHLGMRWDDYCALMLSSGPPAARRCFETPRGGRVASASTGTEPRQCAFRPDRQARQAARPASLLPQLVRASRPCSHADAAIRRKRTRHGRQDWPLTRVRAAALVAAGVNHEKRSA